MSAEGELWLAAHKVLVLHLRGKLYTEEGLKAWYNLSDIHDKQEKEPYGPRCLGCGENEFFRTDTTFHTFWTTADQHDLEAGMYHDKCFWDKVREKENT